MIGVVVGLVVGIEILIEFGVGFMVDEDRNDDSHRQKVEEEFHSGI